MDWRDEFRSRMLNYLVRQGGPVSETSRWYDWHAEDALELQAHFSPAMWQGQYLLASDSRRIADWTEGVPADGCPLDVTRCSWEDTSWTEWGGTFGEDWRATGIEVRVFCRCGRVAGRLWRYEGGYAELLRAITEPE